MPISVQVLEAIKKYFRAEKPERILEILDRYKSGSPEDVKLACLELSNGDVSKLEDCIKVAMKDNRDILQQAMLRPHVDKTPPLTRDTKEISVSDLLKTAASAGNAGRGANAITAYNEIIRRDSANIEAYYQRAGIYWSQYEYQKATADYQKVLELAPDHPNADKIQEWIKRASKQP
jgi:tetratricopeptide (TPR) repeat protein